MSNLIFNHLKTENDANLIVKSYSNTSNTSGTPLTTDKASKDTKSNSMKKANLHSAAQKSKEKKIYEIEIL